MRTFIIDLCLMSTRYNIRHLRDMIIQIIRPDVRIFMLSGMCRCEFLSHIDNYLYQFTVRKRTCISCLRPVINQFSAVQPPA